MPPILTAPTTMRDPGAVTAAWRRLNVADPVSGTLAQRISDKRVLIAGEDFQLTAHVSSRPVFLETQIMAVSPTHRLTDMICTLERLGDGTTFVFQGRPLKKLRQANSFVIVCSEDGSEVHLAPWTPIAVKDIPAEQGMAYYAEMLAALERGATVDWL